MNADMRESAQKALERVRESIRNAESSLSDRFGGDMPADPGSAVQDLAYAVGNLADLVEELVDSLSKEEGAP